MVRKFFFRLFQIGAAVAVLTIAAAPAAAQFGQGNSPNNLFSQYYTQPGASMTQAGMYPAPHYVPENVGHTYNTYQPLMPHEMMYQHSRNYYNYYNTGGYYGGADALNKTQVRWQAGANHMGPMPFSGAAFQALQWKYQQSRYCLGGDGGLGYGLGNGGAGFGRGGLGRGGLLHRGHGGGCAGGDCGGGISYEGASYDAGSSYFGGETFGDVYDAGGSIGGGCASGSCAANLSDSVKR